WRRAAAKLRRARASRACVSWWFPGRKWIVVRPLPTGGAVSPTLTQTARGKQGPALTAQRSIDRDFTQGVAWPRHGSASEAAPNPSPKAQRSRYGDQFQRQRQAGQRQRAREHPPPVGAARGTEAQRDQIRMRRRPVRRVHG